MASQKGKEGRQGLPVMEFSRAGMDYFIDAAQRWVLFSDILRRRGNNYLEHLRQGQPPVLVFDYETILDGRQFEKPVNYALVRIIDRRAKETEPVPESCNRRDKPAPDPAKPWRRPIVVIDPRAGHGPGIGGSKLDSQIGVALNFGHPVYFILFFTDPEPGQTLHDVQQAEVLFVEEVRRRHPECEKPAVIGNCQAGWAAALIGADRPEVVGPLVFNGSPLSYWGGVEGANPMRYTGGLLGGSWLTSLWCDLGNGKFDGAHLVSNFENLNPANTLWTKQYNLWAKVDTEAERYLGFEKWWGGFFKLNREEILAIVNSLFVGNELEAGTFRFQDGRSINLKNLQDPIVVFASMGDNITPPQQALNWIVKVYGTVDEIKRNGQVIVYLLHRKIGHLGIFVSGSVAEREHKEIITSVETLDYLSPGLYEMVIEEEPSRPWLNDHKVSFVERDMSDILALDDGLDDELPFQAVAAVSRLNRKVYDTYFSPAIKMFSNESTARLIRQLHPLRVQRYAFSDLNPFLWPLKSMATSVEKNRKPVAENNPFVTVEKTMSNSIQILLDYYRDMRDASGEFLFNAIYRNPWMTTLFNNPEAPAEKPTEDYASNPELEAGLWRSAMEKGGFRAGAVRVMLAAMGAKKAYTRDQFRVAGKIIKVNDRLKHVSQSELKKIVKTQALFLRRDEEMALGTLIHLLPNKEDRVEAFEIANSIATADLDLDSFEEEMLGKLKLALRLGSGTDTWSGKV